MAEFLLQNKAEAIKISIFEYNQEAHMKCVRQEGYAEGVTDGIAIGKSQGIAEGRSQGIIEVIIEGIMELLAELGEVPKEFEEGLSGADVQQLKTWYRLAARAESIEEFLQML